MRASELKAGDWFERNGIRYLAVGKVNGEMVACYDDNPNGDAEYELETIYGEVTPLPSCTGWDWQPEPEPYATRQAAWVEANGVKVGTRVKVVRKAEDFEGGWGSMWRSDEGMDSTIGAIGEVQRFSRDFGLLVRFETLTSRLFPYFVLDPEPSPQPEAVQVREGKFYRRRDGEVVGPMVRATHKWWCVESMSHGVCYLGDGEFCNRYEPHMDLIAEVPEPEKPIGTEVVERLKRFKDQLDTAPLMVTPDTVEPEYRDLVDGETILATDEVFDHQWRPVALGAVGQAYIEQTKDRHLYHMPMRRRIEPEPPAVVAGECECQCHSGKYVTHTVPCCEYVNVQERQLDPEPSPQPEAVQVREGCYEWLLAYYEANEDFASKLGSAMDVFESHFDEQGELLGSGKWRLGELGKALVWVRDATRGFVNQMEGADKKTQPEPDTSPMMSTPDKVEPEPRRHPDACPTTGEVDCGMCSGEYCNTHHVSPCDCDVAERHLEPRRTSPAEPELGKPPSKDWFEEMAEREDGKCTSVGGLAVELGLYEKPAEPEPRSVEATGYFSDALNRMDELTREAASAFEDLVLVMAGNNGRKIATVQDVEQAWSISIMNSSPCGVRESEARS